MESHSAMPVAICEMLNADCDLKKCKMLNGKCDFKMLNDILCTTKMDDRQIEECIFFL